MAAATHHWRHRSCCFGHGRTTSECLLQSGFSHFFFSTRRPPFLFDRLVDISSSSPFTDLLFRPASTTSLVQCAVPRVDCRQTATLSVCPLASISTVTFDGLGRFLSHLYCIFGPTHAIEGPGTTRQPDDQTTRHDQQRPRLLSLSPCIHQSPYRSSYRPRLSLYPSLVTLAPRQHSSSAPQCSNHCTAQHSSLLSSPHCTCQSSTTTVLTVGVLNCIPLSAPLSKRHPAQHDARPSHQPRIRY